ncbi:phosphoribosylglycinamide formyltransferase [Clostridium sp.]|jgi:phosphoribosylglycinamide formyltransferase-1|uniref:phosphoribosylglycinamide formyltransferase n=1 Tax=Clostridium sp. TaxID=1506 RepID=UPI002588CD3B|nr:phosphoribosylglycinamide formyltransferase [Clostridium sp.]MDF2503903.1 phosphoribosylglycinamide formyltransferase, formyltetrahydrofolate-dependent [Clostridium sp.]
MYKIAVLISGGGTNLQSIIDNVKSGFINCKIEIVISDNEKAYGIERARENHIYAIALGKKQYGDKLSDEILKVVEEKDVDLIVTAGFLSILKGDLLKKFKDRIINIHPSLIPSFCGKGMYGLNVHKAAINYGVKVSGCTVHFVDEGTDTGPIIIQKSVPVFAEDTAEILQKRVLEKEHEALPEAIKLISENKVKVQERKVFIKNN